MKRFVYLMSAALGLPLCFHTAVAAAMEVPASPAVVEQNQPEQQPYLVPVDMLSTPYEQAIQRKDLCALLVQAYETFTGEPVVPEGESPFLDIDDARITAAYELGLVSSEEDGLFEPDRAVTRQEMAKLLYHLDSILNGEVQWEYGTALTFLDEGEIEQWAVEPVKAMVGMGILSVDQNGSFLPNGTVSIEESAGIIYRFMDQSGKLKEPVGNEALQVRYSAGETKARITWKPIEGVGSYRVTVQQQRDSRHPGEIAPKDPVTYQVVGGGSLDFDISPVCIYTVTVVGADGSMDRVSFTTDIQRGLSNEEKKAELYPDGEPATGEEAQELMATVTVPVWRLQNGKKVADTAELTVHQAIADRVILVFEEIFNGEEQFPIKSVGAYAWRAPMSGGHLSEHNLGTAIDINPDENYCLYGDGTIVGSFWKPGENPYSINPYGDVVQAFEKYGFTWGGDAWQHTRDYMHFSYFGT